MSQADVQQRGLGSVLPLVLDVEQGVGGAPNAQRVEQVRQVLHGLPGTGYLVSFPRVPGKDKHEERAPPASGSEPARCWDGGCREHTTRSEAGRDSGDRQPTSPRRPTEQLPETKTQPPPPRELCRCTLGRLPGCVWSYTGIPAEPEGKHTPRKQSGPWSPSRKHVHSNAGATGLRTGAPMCRAHQRPGDTPWDHGPHTNHWGHLSTGSLPDPGRGEAPSLPPQVRKPKPQVCPPRAPECPSPTLAAYLSVILLRLPLRLTVSAKLSENPTRSRQSPDSRQVRAAWGWPQTDGQVRPDGDPQRRRPQPDVSRLQSHRPCPRATQDPKRSPRAIASAMCGRGTPTSTSPHGGNRTDLVLLPSSLSLIVHASELGSCEPRVLLNGSIMAAKAECVERPSDQPQPPAPIRPIRLSALSRSVPNRDVHMGPAPPRDPHAAATLASTSCSMYSSAGGYLEPRTHRIPSPRGASNRSAAGRRGGRRSRPGERLTGVWREGAAEGERRSPKGRSPHLESGYQASPEHGHLQGFLHLPQLTAERSRHSASGTKESPERTAGS